ncbi:MAG: SRPBCC domain-containing protein [Chitinophagaceae bacterium]|nr:SRPBCC domain-containing protein [Chitinophagaceae bacterium]
MSKTIVQKIVFKNTSTKDLYSLYMNSKKHSIATGAPAKISPNEGGNYYAHDGYITGKNLQLLKDKLIVQSWRASEWKENDVDSTLIIHLETKGNDVILHAIHANLPDKSAAGIDKGWHDHYWEPWKKYLAGKPIAKSKEM